VQGGFSEEIQSMHARPEIKEILIGQKMRRWSMFARGLLVKATCPPARARKNFWRLCRKYPEIAAKLGLNAASVYTSP